MLIKGNAYCQYQKDIALAKINQIHDTGFAELWCDYEPMTNLIKSFSDWVNKYIYRFRKETQRVGSFVYEQEEVNKEGEGDGNSSCNDNNDNPYDNARLFYIPS